MSRVVLKFGGSSVGDSNNYFDENHMIRIANTIKKEKEAGNQVVVVISAMAGETRKLKQMSQNIDDRTNTAEDDIILSVGEQISVGLLSKLLNGEKYNQKSKAFMVWQLPIIKDDKFLPKKYTCRIKQIKYQIDETGMIREKLTFAEGKTTFKEGIEFIMNYLKYKDKISINNTFKCPILFKNFEEKEIPPNKVIMCEIKSGFDVEELKRQLIERIEAMKYFIFNNGENPLYFIGIVNLDSNNVNKLTKYLDYNFEMKENILIATAVDFKYFDMDLSYEVDSGYLLFKRIGNIESKIDDLACTLCSINTKFENLTNEIKLIHPLHKFSYITQTEKNQNINNRRYSFYFISRT